MKLFFMELVSAFVDKALLRGSHSKNMARGDWQSNCGTREQAAAAEELVLSGVPIPMDAVESVHCTHETRAQT